MLNSVSESVALLRQNFAMGHRKVTPRVRDGRVASKNRAALTEPDSYALGASLQIVKRAPGPGQVNVVDEHDVRRFLALLPDWPTLGAGIHAIVLDNELSDCDGYYRGDGVIHLSSWPRDITVDLNPEYVESHRAIFERIGIPFDPPKSPPASGDGEEPGALVRCWFDPLTARDYLLMHVFLHELGHHEDVRTRRRGGHSRGEEFAESWAITRELNLWPYYRAVFPRRARNQCPRSRPPPASKESRQSGFSAVAAAG